jgi:transcriptional regulator with XRE-family HTH domain
MAGLIRAWRDRIEPSSVGLAIDARRAPGLRREELALLAGLSVDYVVRLEQGRATRPSVQVVSALARALCLSADETEMLHRSAGLTPPTSPIERRVPESIARLVERLSGFPVGIYSADWWLLRWNARWAALLGDPGPLTGRDRNLVWQVFTGNGWRAEPADRPLAEFQQALVADLRVTVVEHPNDVGVLDLVAALRTASPRFAEQWAAGHIARHRAERKRVRHPRLGELILDCDVLQSPGDGVNVVVYSAPSGSAEAELLKQAGDGHVSVNAVGRHLTSASE